MLSASRKTPRAEKPDPESINSEPSRKRPQRINRRNEHCSVQSSVQVLHAHNQQCNPSHPIPHNPQPSTLNPQPSTLNPTQPHPLSPPKDDPSPCPTAQKQKQIIKLPPCRILHEIVLRLTSYCIIHPCDRR